MKKVLPVLLIILIVVGLSIFLVLSPDQEAPEVPFRPKDSPTRWEDVKSQSSTTKSNVHPEEVTTLQTEQGKLLVIKEAVTETVTIFMKTYTDGWSEESKRVAVGVELKPDGLQFQKPVLLTLNLPSPLKPGLLIPVEYRGSLTASTSAEPIVGIVSGEGKKVRFAIRHFSEYVITLDEIRKAVNLNSACDFGYITDPQTVEKKYIRFGDFKESAVLNGDPIFSFKGMSDKASREISFKYALGQAILQTQLPDTIPEEWADKISENSEKVFDELAFYAKESQRAAAAIKIPAVRSSQEYKEFLSLYRSTILRWSKHATLKAAHNRLAHNLDEISQNVGLAAAAGTVGINIGKDVYQALLIQSLDDELLDKRIKILRIAMEGKADVPREILDWLDEVEKKIEKERKDLWVGIGQALQEDSIGELVLPLSNLVNQAGPFLSAGWAKVAGKLALPIGVIIEVAETLIKIDDFLWMVGETTAAATLAYLYLPSESLEKYRTGEAVKQDSPELVQIRAYLNGLSYDLYAKAYEGNLIDHGIRWLLGSIHDLTGFGPEWSEQRLERLLELKSYHSSLCVKAHYFIQNQSEEGEEEQINYPARIFNSDLPLIVWVMETSKPIFKIVGETPRNTLLHIPACYAWGVQTTGKKIEWKSLIEVMNQQEIPGLCLGRATDSDLRRLKEIPNLQIFLIAMTKIHHASLEHQFGELEGSAAFTSNIYVTDSGLVNLKGLNQLHYLSLWGCTKIQGSGLIHLQALKNLQTLNLRETAITNESLVHLKGLHRLRNLYLGTTVIGPKITDEGVIHLKEMSNLENLDLGGCDITDAGLIHLKELNILQGLYLGKTQITDAGLLHLQAMSNLRRLDLHWNGKRITDAGIVHLKGMTNLQILNLNITDISNDGLKHLKELPNLQVLGLSFNRYRITDTGLEHLKGLSNRQILNLALSRQVTNAEWVELKGMTNLKRLYLIGCQTTDEGEKQLQEDLPDIHIIK